PIGTHMPDPAAQFDCRECGACCSYSYDWPQLEWDGSDSENIPEAMVVEETQCLKCTGNRCGALVGVVGEKVSCSIYQDRPRVCREFLPGTDDCARVRDRTFRPRPISAD